MTESGRSGAPRRRFATTTTELLELELSRFLLLSFSFPTESLTASALRGVWVLDHEPDPRVSPLLAC